MKNKKSPFENIALSKNVQKKDDKKNKKVVENKKRVKTLNPKKAAKKRKKEIEFQEQSIKKMNANPVKLSDVTFANRNFLFYGLKNLFSSPSSLFFCILMAALIAGILVICVQLVIYLSALAYCDYVRNSMISDIQNLLDDLVNHDDIINGIPVDRASGTLARLIVVIGLKDNIQDIIHSYYNYVTFVPGTGGGYVYIELYGREITLQLIMFIFIPLALGILVAYYFQGLLSGKIGVALELKIRKILLRKILFHDYAFFIENSYDDIVDAYISAPNNIGNYAKSFSSIMPNVILTILGITALLSTIDILFSLINLIIIILVIFVCFLAGVFNSSSVLAKANTDKIVNFATTERIINARNIKANGTWDLEFSNSVMEIVGSRFKKWRINVTLSLFASIIMAALLSQIFITGAIGVLMLGEDSTWLLSLYCAIISGSIVISGQLYPLQTLQNNRYKAILSTKAIKAILIRDIEINKFEGIGSVFGGLKKGIEFKNVSFAYPDEPDNLLINKFNLTIAKGEKVGIIGQSGCGKSTLIKLLLSYYLPVSGSILIDGRPIQSINLRTWLEKTSYIDQSPQLLSTTIFDNLVYGVKKFNTQEVIRASRGVKIHDFIMNLPDNYKTVVENGGERFSGGQKQRICIARTVIKKPDIAFLDEATSKLDNITEIQVMDEILDILNKEKITCLSIAHKLTSLSGFDRIIKLAPKIGIVQQGSFNDMIVVNETLNFLNPNESKKLINHAKEVAEKNVSKKSFNKLFSN